MTLGKAGKASEPLLPTSRTGAGSSNGLPDQVESPPSYDACTTSASAVSYELETTWPVSDTISSGEAVGALGGTREARPPNFRLLHSLQPIARSLVTLDILIDLFPQLATVDRSRIGLFLPGSFVSALTMRPDPSDPSSSALVTVVEPSWEQSQLTDHDWPALVRLPSPPAVIEVIVRDEWPVALVKLVFLLAVGLLVMGTTMAVATAYLDNGFRTPCALRFFGC